MNLSLHPGYMYTDTKEKVLSYLKAHGEIISGENWHKRLACLELRFGRRSVNWKSKAIISNIKKQGYRLLASDVMKQPHCVILIYLKVRSTIAKVWIRPCIKPNKQR